MRVEVEQLIEFTKVITAFIYEWCHTENRFVVKSYEYVYLYDFY